MKRRSFIKTSLIAAPAATIAQRQSSTDRSPNGFVTRAGEGRYHGHIQLKGVNDNILDVKVSGKDTNGDMALFEQTSLSPRRGTPLHIHFKQDEVFHVKEGEYLFLVGEDRYTLKAGDSIFLPRNVAHAWTQMSERGRVTVIFQPAGKMEEFFVAMAALDKVPDQEAIAAIFASHDMKVAGPPLKVD